jgi:biotin carboxyl carrier protein
MKKHLRITVNGKDYDVLAEILDDSAPPPHAAAPGTPLIAAAAAVPPAPPPAPAPRHATLPAAAAGELRSPLAGKVVSIDAAVGTSVVAGQTVITLEAMKMNTLVAATAAGTVAAVHVKPGDSVEDGQLLMTLA